MVWVVPPPPNWVSHWELFTNPHMFRMLWKKISEMAHYVEEIVHIILKEIKFGKECTF